MSPLSEKALIVIAGVNLLFVLVLAVVVAILYREVKRLRQRADPLLKDLHQLVSDLSPHLHQIAASAEGVVETTEHRVKDLSRRIEVTLEVLQEAILPPLVQSASWVAGVLQALSSLVKPSSSSEPKEE
jgi:predicted PurR-regulated permease PerM